MEREGSVAENARAMERAVEDALLGQPWTNEEIESKIQPTDAWMLALRHDIQGRLGHVIPSREVVTGILERANGARQIVDAGCGKGILAQSLAACGGVMMGVDRAGVGDAASLRRNGRRVAWLEAHAPAVCRKELDREKVLLLSWPPYEDPENMGAACAAAVPPGGLLIEIGEGRGGCTGSEAMWELLEKEFEPEGAPVACARLDPMVRDYVQAWRRRETRSGE